MRMTVNGKEEQPQEQSVKDGRCYIVGAGKMKNPGWIKHQIKMKEHDCLIAADGGFALCERCGLHVDMVVGDFDSLGNVPAHPNVIALPREKDETDLLFAVKKGLEKGYTKFEIYGALGGRAGHTMANYQTLAYLARRGACGILREIDLQVTAICNVALRLPAYKSGYVSVFALDNEVRGVTLRGLKFPLDKATLTNDDPLGVSNEFIGEKAEIAVEDGTLLVMWQTM